MTLFKKISFDALSIPVSGEVWWSMVGHLFQNYVTTIRAVFSHVYLQSFLLHDIRAFFCHVYLRFIPRYMTIFLQTRIYMRTKKSIYTRFKQACGIWVTESRRRQEMKMIFRHKAFKLQGTNIDLRFLCSIFILNFKFISVPRGSNIILCPFSYVR